MLTDYKSIVFDLGGVIFNLDHARCVANLQALGLEDAASLLDLYCQSGLFLSLEKGEISSGQFFDVLRAKARPGVSDARLTEAVNSFITNLPVSRLQALRSLKERGFRLFALSNTNPVMYPTVLARLFRQEGLAINDYFEGIVTSFEEQVCKPDPAIFRILLRRYSLNPGETLFLDDSARNCHAAEELGIHTALIPEGVDFTDILSFV